MNSLKESLNYLISKYGKSTILNELNDYTYLSAASIRNSQSRDPRSLLSHSKDMLVKKFIKELTSFDWFHSNTISSENKFNSNWIKLTFTDNLNGSYSNRDSFDSSLFSTIQRDISSLCNKYGKLVHSFDFRISYSNELPHCTISFLSRENPLPISPSTVLYHVTNRPQAIESIIKSGLKPQSSRTYSNSNYSYSCIFALSKKSAISKYIRQINKKSGYYVISFLAGDNIYFNDSLQNHTFASSDNSYSSYEFLSKKWHGTAIYTLTDISPQQIISIDYYKNNKFVENIYSK